MAQKSSKTAFFLKHIYCFALVFTLVSCSGINVIKRRDTSHLYSKTFMNTISQAKSDLKARRTTRALKALRSLKKDQITPIEMAYRDNLIGVIVFSRGEYESAVFHFDTALMNSGQDPGLTSQIHLNLASTYFKLKAISKSAAELRLVDSRELREREEKKFYRLSFIVAEQQDNTILALDSLVRYLGMMSSLNELRSSSELEKAVNLFSQLSRTEKVRFLEEFEDLQLISAGYLAYVEAEKLYLSGEKERASDLLEWSLDRFSKSEDLNKLSQTLLERMSRSSRVNPSAVGVILPFSGEHAKFAKRAMLGIDYGFKSLAEAGNSPTLYYKDSKASSVLGAEAVEELVTKFRVSMIIGGLTADEAIREYLEAKKHGVLFISLYPVYLPRSQKGPLLVEIPGSVESQIHHILKENVVEFLGKKVGVVYPQNRRGQTFVNEFWEQTKAKGLEISQVQSFRSDQKDFTSPIKKFLDLAYSRERSEEKKLLEGIHALERRQAVRRLQTLSPVLDFDWVFLPVSPNEALQIIPAFAWFDARRVKFVGGPSWRSRKISKRTSKSGPVYFVGDDIGRISQEMKEGFREQYQSGLRPIEIASFDAFKVAQSILKGSDFSSRSELESYMRRKDLLEGVSGDWRREDNLWIKSMAALKLNRGQVTYIEEPRD